MTQLDCYYELSYYTLAHPDTIYFIHQHIVDAYHAQTADEKTKVIEVVFSLVGLYLLIEKDCTGRQIQNIHIELSKYKNNLPKIKIPQFKGKITVADVLQVQPGGERDEVIKAWCASVWLAYQEQHEIIFQFVHQHVKPANKEF